MAVLILQRILGVDPYATVAIILPSEMEARHWHDLLRDDLAANHRPALLSHRDDLTRRVDIHFTEVCETKGLEFDVVIVPDLSSFEFESAVGINQVYVAISRSKHALLMGCNERALDREELMKLIASRVIRYAEIPASLAN
jgi:DNA helicase IV